MKFFGAGLLGTVLLAGCHSPAMFPAVPKELDRGSVPHQTIQMTAECYEFKPEVLRVPAGTLVTLEITALDRTHGFALDAFGIDERLEKGEKKVIEFFASERGEYAFDCSHFCGLGHLGMNGKLIVE